MAPRAGERVQRFDRVEATVGQRPLAAIGGHAREPRTRRRLLAPAVLAGEHPARQREVWEDGQPVARAGRQQVAFAPPPEQAQLVLHAHEAGRAVLLGRQRGVVDPRAVEVRAPDLAHLAGLDELVQRAEGIGDRNGGVGRVELI